MRWRGWRYVRNLCLLGALVFLALAGAALAVRSAWHWLWAAPLMVLVFHTWRLFSMVHPAANLLLALLRPEDFRLPVAVVRFPSRDGLRLSGWFVPGSNRAAVMLVHGLGGGAAGMLPQADFLHRLGYSVLLFDLRAHGASQGGTSTFGVCEAQDVLGALDYLRQRPEVDTQRIGLLGVSLGAQAGLQAAVTDSGLRALALEGLGPLTLDDYGGQPDSLRRKLNQLFNWFSDRFADWLSGAPPARGVLQALGELGERPLLLIAAERSAEPRFNRRFQQAAGAACSLWVAPGAWHAAAYSVAQQEYRRRVQEFFEANLG